MTKKTAFYSILLVFTILKFILQYTLINPAFELHRDEFLHLDQANHLAWGYFSVPPFTSWISLIIKFLGNGVFWVKFFPALFGCITLYFVLKSVTELGGSVYALLIAAITLTFSVILRLNTLFQPNSADVMFWTMAYYFLIRYVNTKSSGSLLWLGVSVAFGILNKYNILFLIAGLLPALLLSIQRKIVLDKRLYSALALGLLIILPNMVWQVANSFPVVSHMKELSKTQLVNVDRLGFLKEQVLYFFNSIFIILAAFAGMLFNRQLRTYQFVLLSYVFTLSIFLILKGKGYYAIGLYPVLISFGSVYFENILAKGWVYYIRYVLPVVIVGLYIPLIGLIFPLRKPEDIYANKQKLESIGMLRWEDGKNHQLPQDFADMLGWKEIAGLVLKAKSMIPANEYTLIRAENYGQAGAINFYGDNPGALSYNADYLRWFPADKNYRNLIIIREKGSEPSARERGLFEDKIYVGKVENELAREYGTYVYILRNAKTNIAPIIESDVSERLP